MSKIVRVIPKENYCLEVVLDNESSVNLSFVVYLQRMRFASLTGAVCKIRQTKRNTRSSNSYNRHLENGNK